MFTLVTKLGTFEIETKSLADISVKTNVVSSRAEFKRLLDQGAIYLNNKRLDRNSVIWSDREVSWGGFKATLELPVIRMLWLVFVV